MRYLTTLILSMNVALACQISIPESYVQTFLNPPVSGHYMKCEASSGERCHCVDKINPFYAEFVDNIVLDFIRKENTQSCDPLVVQPATESDCDTKFTALVCAEGVAIKNLDQSEVYCAVDVMKVDGKKLVESDVKKAAYQSSEAARLQLASALQTAKKAMDCGKSAQQLLLVRNSTKNLSKEQVKQLIVSYSTIKNLLDSGSLATAIDEIQAVVTDEVIVTDADKTALITHISGCKP